MFKHFRILALFVGFLAYASMQAAVQPRVLQADLDKLQALFIEKAPDAEIQSFMLDLSKRHQLRGSVSSLGKTPEARRLVVEYGNVVRQHEDLLLELSFNSAYRSSSVLAHNYLWFMPPSEDFRGKLVALSDEHPYAYEVLFHTRQFDEEVKNKFVDTVISEPSQVKRDALADMSAKWAIEEMMPVYREMLSRPFLAEHVKFYEGFPTDDPRSNLGAYQRAANYMMHMGTKASELLPLLNERIGEITKKFPEPHPLLVSKLKTAVEVAEGKRERQLVDSYNQTGPIVDRTTPSFFGVSYVEFAKENSDAGILEDGAKPRQLNWWYVVAGVSAISVFLVLYGRVKM